MSFILPNRGESLDEDRLKELMGILLRLVLVLALFKILEFITGEPFSDSVDLIVVIMFSQWFFAQIILYAFEDFQKDLILMFPPNPVLVFSEEDYIRAVNLRAKARSEYWKKAPIFWDDLSPWLDKRPGEETLIDPDGLLDWRPFYEREFQ